VLMVLSSLGIFTLMAALLLSDAFTQKNAIQTGAGKGERTKVAPDISKIDKSTYLKTIAETKTNPKDNTNTVHKMTPVPIDTILSGLKAAEKRVFCFGDSLTAGTSPPGHEMYPYALNLETALELQDAGPPGAAIVATNVHFRGYPGWTASLLRTDAGLDSILTKFEQLRTEEHVDQNDPDLDHLPPPFDVVIVLAGTNDMAHESDPEIIFQSIRGIHEMALAKGCPTIALGIPPSGWQAQSEPARTLATSVNEKLASWASSTTSSIFLPFPIEIFDRSTGYWSVDGLHLSQSGYKFLGTSLAPIVAEILWKDDDE
jgi:lysophospholipase L1-like esterase